MSSEAPSVLAQLYLFEIVKKPKLLCKLKYKMKYLDTNNVLLA